jgi:Ca2+-binding RTX toxin-like protein
MLRTDRSVRQGNGAGQDPQAQPRASTLHPDTDNAVALPSMGFATPARFVRQGDDLVLESTDGSVAVVTGYFTVVPPPTLTTPDGGYVDSALVRAFTEPHAPGQYAQIDAPSGSASIGRIRDLVGDVFVTRADGTREQLSPGDAVFQGDIVETTGDATVALLFADGATLSLDGDGRLALQDLAIDPITNTMSSTYALLKGVFVYTHGRVTGTATIETFGGTLETGRGTVVGEVVPGAESRFTLIEGAATVATRSGTVTLDQPNATTTLARADQPPTEPFILSEEEVSALYGSAGDLEDIDTSAGDPSGDAGGIPPLPGLDSPFRLDPNSLFEPTTAPPPVTAPPILPPLTATPPDDSSATPDDDDDDDAVAATAETGINIITGTVGDDTLFGTVGADHIDGKGGSDLLNGGGGDDTLIGNTGDDIVFGGSGDDLFVAEAEASNDQYDGGLGQDTLAYSSEGRPIFISLFNGTATSELNEILFNFTEIEDVSVSGGGRATLHGNNAANTLIGSEGRDHIEGFSGNDVLVGNGGNDNLRGGRDNDTIFGGDGSDLIDSGSGSDHVFGGAGDDRLIYDPFDATVNGGPGIDTLHVNNSSAGSGGIIGITSIFEEIDGAALANTAGVEKIDLKNFEDNTLALTAAEVETLSDTGTLTVTGDFGDIMTSTDDWTTVGTMMQDGTTFNKFTFGTNTLLIESVIDASGASSGTFPFFLGVPGGEGFQVLGEVGNDRAGDTVASAGDVNGDGIDDLLIGAPKNGNGFSPEGAAYLVYGSASTGSTVTLGDIALGTGGFKITGENGNDYVGSSVSSAGDINGDGIDDLIVGAGGGIFGARNGGAAYVIFGTTSTVSAIDLASVAQSTGGFKVTAEGLYDHAGSSVSAAGDVNGDGIDDLIVGATNVGAVGEGAAYIVFGTASSVFPVSLGDVGNGTGGFKIIGQTAFDHVGESVSAIGDINDDGFDDVIVGTVSDDAGGPNAGAAYVIFGATPNSSAIDLDDIARGVGGFKIIGQSAGDFAGRSVSSAGDVNGDGIDDLIIGAFLNDSIDDAAGAAYVIFGTSSNPRSIWTISRSASVASKSTAKASSTLPEIRFLPQVTLMATASTMSLLVRLPTTLEEQVRVRRTLYLAARHMVLR